MSAPPRPTSAPGRRKTPPQTAEHAAPHFIIDDPEVETTTVTSSSSSSLSTSPDRARWDGGGGGVVDDGRGGSSTQHHSSGLESWGLAPTTHSSVLCFDNGSSSRNSNGGNNQLPPAPPLQRPPSGSSTTQHQQLHQHHHAAGIPPLPVHPSSSSSSQHQNYNQQQGQSSSVMARNMMMMNSGMMTGGIASYFSGAAEIVDEEEDPVVPKQQQYHDDGSRSQDPQVESISFETSNSHIKSPVSSPAAPPQEQQHTAADAAAAAQEAVRYDAPTSPIAYVPFMSPPPPQNSNNNTRSSSMLPSDPTVADVDDISFISALMMSPSSNMATTPAKAGSVTRSSKRLRELIEADHKLKEATLATVREALPHCGSHTAVVRNAVWDAVDREQATGIAPSKADTPEERWAQFCNTLVTTVRNNAPADYANVNTVKYVLTEATKFLKAEGRLQQIMRTDGEAARSVVRSARAEAEGAAESLAAMQDKVSALHEQIAGMRREIENSNRRVSELEDVRHKLQLGIARTASKVLGGTTTTTTTNKQQRQICNSGDNNGDDDDADDDYDDNGGAVTRSLKKSADDERRRTHQHQQQPISVKETNPMYYINILESVASEVLQLRIEMDAALFIGSQQTEWAIKEGQEAERIVNRLAAAKDQLADCSTHMMDMRSHIAKLEAQLEPLKERETLLQVAEHAFQYHESLLWSNFAFPNLNGAHADALVFAARAFLKTAPVCTQGGGRITLSAVPGDTEKSSVYETVQQRNSALGVVPQPSSGSGNNLNASASFSSSMTLFAAPNSSSSSPLQQGSSSFFSTSMAGGGGGGSGSSQNQNNNLQVLSNEDAYGVLPHTVLGGSTALAVIDGINLVNRKLASGGGGVVFDGPSIVAFAKDALSRFPSWPEGRVAPARSSPTAMYDSLLRAVLAGNSANFPNYIPPPPSTPAKARNRLAAEYVCQLLSAAQREGLAGFSECFLVHSLATGQMPISALRALPRLAERLFVRLQSNVTTGAGGSGGAAAGTGAGGAGGGGGGGASAIAPPPPSKKKTSHGAVVARDIFLRTVRDMFPRASEATILALALATFAVQEKPSADLSYVPYFKDKEHPNPGMVLTAIYHVALDEQRAVVQELQTAVAQVAWRRYTAAKEKEDLAELEDAAGSGDASTASGGGGVGTPLTSLPSMPMPQTTPTTTTTTNKEEPPHEAHAFVTLRDFGSAVFAVNPHCPHKEMAKIVSVAAGDPKIETDYMTRMRTNASASITAVTSGAKQPIEMAALNRFVRISEAFVRIRHVLFLEMYDRLSVEAEEGG